ncbi:MAG: hypothetical protein HOQ11_16835 [Gemmatimonadaceae bacterium]|nr:hypothetical protein [Gemmatimonadaceae bacterium]NUQ91826.1 hypothetical protein [Gemmatimonadaceae bacterium]NUR20885.1 hypothetical protein [Gemmatimonadaceae bacterium]NUS99070.1 hypothetical protein [Gemmatimonadaceae bacterium]
MPTPTIHVLILACEPVIAALLALLMELDGFTADFPQPGERPEDAIARLHPPLVVCADGGLPEAESDLFLARASRRGRVVLFSVPELAPMVRARAEERGFPYFELPVDREKLARVLNEAAAT